VAEYETAVANAKDGDVIGPVKTEFGYHVISVTSTYHERSLDEARDSILERFRDPQGQGWAEYTLRKAKVTVDRRYGAWNGDTYSVSPPEGAAADTPN
jgi:parvulin-like peptidyl-prolyl isomerase